MREVIAQRMISLAKSIVSGDVAKTILEQMGGMNRIRAMTGAYNFLDGGDSVSFLFPNRKRSRGNSVMVTYDRGSDTYTMEFFNVSIKGAKKVKSVSGVYADQLISIFSKQTGLDLKL